MYPVSPSGATNHTHATMISLKNTRLISQIEWGWQWATLIFFKSRIPRLFESRWLELCTEPDNFLKKYQTMNLNHFTNRAGMEMSPLNLFFKNRVHPPVQSTCMSTTHITLELWFSYRIGESPGENFGRNFMQILTHNSQFLHLS